MRLMTVLPAVLAFGSVVMTTPIKREDIENNSWGVWVDPKTHEQTFEPTDDSICLWQAPDGDTVILDPVPAGRIEGGGCCTQNDNYVISGCCPEPYAACGDDSSAFQACYNPADYKCAPDGEVCPIDYKIVADDSDESNGYLCELWKDGKLKDKHRAQNSYDQNIFGRPLPIVNPPPPQSTSSKSYAAPTHTYKASTTQYSKPTKSVYETVEPTEFTTTIDETVTTSTELAYEAETTPAATDAEPTQAYSAPAPAKSKCNKKQY
ncbi:hypothetical protein HDV00_004936 [Rhizophlyctis rosea]|nr:hypothetical protein HDV00_004936 [Rhizophlyctis rosea]